MKSEQDKIRYPGTRRSSTKAFIRQMICQQLLFNFCCFRCYILILSTIVSDTILDTNLDIYLYMSFCITYTCTHTYHVICTRRSKSPIHTNTFLRYFLPSQFPQHTVVLQRKIHSIVLSNRTFIYKSWMPQQSIAVQDIKPCTSI